MRPCSSRASRGWRHRADRPTAGDGRRSFLCAHFGAPSRWPLIVSSARPGRRSLVFCSVGYRTRYDASCGARAGRGAQTFGRSRQCRSGKSLWGYLRRRAKERHVSAVARGQRAGRGSSRFSWWRCRCSAREYILSQPGCSQVKRRGAPFRLARLYPAAVLPPFVVGSSGDAIKTCLCAQGTARLADDRWGSRAGM